MIEPEVIKAKLNLETSQIAWRELQRFFAAGVVFAASAELDLIEAAAQISADNREQIEKWLDSGLLARVSDSQALRWYETDATLWAIVLSPWVLVQEAKSAQPLMH